MGVGNMGEFTRNLRIQIYVHEKIRLRLR
jgi:hypothetical protein